MLLVDDDEPEPGDRREDRRARPDRDPRLAGAQAPPLVVALALAERGVQQRDGVAEARLEAPDGLRGQRDLRHEHDHALAALERPRGGAQVDLGLARAGDAVQQVLAAGVDRRERRRLRRGQLDRAVDGRPRQRLAALRARLDRHQPALLQPPQRAEVLARRARQAVEQRALALAQPLAVEARGRPPRPQPHARLARPAAARARAPAPASTRTPSPSTARARRGRAARSPRAPRSAPRAARRAARSPSAGRPRPRRAPGGRTAPARRSRPRRARRAARSRTAPTGGGWWSGARPGRSRR